MTFLALGWLKWPVQVTEVQMCATGEEVMPDELFLRTCPATDESVSPAQQQRLVQVNVGPLLKSLAAHVVAEPHVQRYAGVELAPRYDEDFMASFVSSSEGNCKVRSVTVMVRYDAHLDGLLWIIRSETPAHAVHVGHALKTHREWDEGSICDVPVSSFLFNNTLVYFAFLPASAWPKAQILGTSFVLRVGDDWVKETAGSGRDFYLAHPSPDSEPDEEHPFAEFLCPIDHRDMTRLMCLYREKCFWSASYIGQSLSDVPEEIQFLILASGSDEQASLSFHMPLVDKGANTRASLRACSAGFVVRVESGCAVLNLPDHAWLLISSSTRTTGFFAPHTAPLAAFMGQIWETLRSRGFGGTPLSEKISESVLTTELGWCSWDAFDLSVSSDLVNATMRRFVDQGVPISYVILDDGWQSSQGGEHADGVGWEASGNYIKPTLTGFGLNHKFEPGFIQGMKHDFHVRAVLVWHSLIGYWGGVDPAFAQQMDCETFACRGKFGRGLRRNSLVEHATYWEKQYSPVCARDVARFLDDYHASLRQVGVDGVKVDEQAILEAVAHADPSSAGGRVDSTVRYRGALESSVARNFPEKLTDEDDQAQASLLMNCMSCSNEHIFSAGRHSVLWRTSDDHAFPHTEESAFAVGKHIWTNALNTLWLGHLFVPDWDMFRVAEWHARLHACARVIGGSPLYISDRAECLDDPQSGARQLLGELTLPNGRIVRAMRGGVPVLRCVMHNPLREKMLYVLWNVNLVHGMLAVFNLCSQREWGAEPITGEVFPTDIEPFGKQARESDVFVLWNYALAEAFERRAHEALVVSLHDMNCCIFVVARCVDIGGGDSLAVLGLDGKMNAGGVIERIVWDAMSDSLSVQLVPGTQGDIIVWYKCERGRLRDNRLEKNATCRFRPAQDKAWNDLLVQKHEKNDQLARIQVDEMAALGNQMILSFRPRQ
ncbi:putative galactinol--sucrose galactosyltransferase 6 [Porphyridium purpureum]|uniref:galactinol--sucrose galactosyltransferase n=1 Tax=Porphyridium purpureum TaxID=35688 RepID=A0A5J4Z216_PORPP|nr:putative galactinol--sucrose galactosyltransferase 6 [Porphyridium purpureum]|eukprot:POR9254..scf208_2